MKKIIIIGFIVWNSVFLIGKVQAQEGLQGKSSLKEQLKEISKEVEEAPQNAVIDPIWKAVPGYNGRKLNIKKSYEKMKMRGNVREQDYIFDEIAPQIHLRELPPTPLYRGNEAKKMVAMTINVAKGWKDNSILLILEILKKEKIRVTFFLEGQWAAENEELVRRMAQEGHEIGNHTYQHADPVRVSSERFRSELKRTNDAIEKVIGKKVIWFAPPSGSYNERAVNEAFQQGMWTVMWSVDTIDWRRPPAFEIVQRVEKKVHPGAIILMHPTKPTSEALETMINLIRKKNLQMGTLSQLVDEKRLE